MARRVGRRWTCLGPRDASARTGRRRCYVRHQSYAHARRCAARGKPARHGWETHLEGCGRLGDHRRACAGEEACS